MQAEAANLIASVVTDQSNDEESGSTQGLTGRRRISRRSVTPARYGQLVFYVPTDDVGDWRRRLAQPEKHWAVGRSAMMLACCWEEAAGFPPEVSQLMDTLPVEYRPIEFLAAFPEHKTPLPGGSRSSQSDILVLGASGDRLVAIAVEGKVDEGFDHPVTVWLGADPSQGRQVRLRFLCEALG